MALKIASAFVSLEVEQSKVGRGLRDSKGRFVKAGTDIGQASGKAITSGITSSIKGGGLAKAFRRIGEIAAGNIAAKAVAGLTRALAGSIPAAQEQIAVEKRLSAALQATGHAAGFTADQLKKQAAELQNVTNFGDETTIASQAILATFKNTSGVNFSKAIESAQDIATVMGGDLRGATLQLGKALNDPATGLTMLNRVGITFSKEQQNVIKSLQATGQMAKAQGLILAEVASQFGGAARASRDPLLQLKNTMGDVSEELGTALMPLMIDFSKVMTKTIVSGVRDVIAVFKNFGDNVKLTLADVGISFLEFAPIAQKPIADLLAFTAGAFAGMKVFVLQFIEQIKAAFNELKNLGEAASAGLAAALENKLNPVEAGKAFRKAFDAKLAGQKQNAIPENPFTASGKAFKSAREGVLSQISQGGGLLEILKADREAMSASALRQNGGTPCTQSSGIPASEYRPSYQSVGPMPILIPAG